MAEYLSSYKEGFQMENLFGDVLKVNSATPGQTISILRSMLLEQKATAESLLETAKKIGPSAQKIVQAENAYNAAFESDVQAPLPTFGGTFQGFILIFFFISYIVMAFVTTFMVNAISGLANAGLTFVGFIFLAVVIFSVIYRFG